MLSDRHIQNRTGMADKVFQYECVILTNNMFEYFSSLTDIKCQSRYM